MKVLGLFTWMCLACLPALAQKGKHSVFIGTQFPLQYALGYEYQFGKRFALQAQAGLLRPPFGKVILNTMEEVGSDPELTVLIDDSFKSGTLFHLAPKLVLGHWYIAGFGQLALLQASQSPLSAFKTYFTKRSFQALDNEPNLSISMKPTLFNAGAMLGRRMLLAERWELDISGGISKTFTASNQFSSQRPANDSRPSPDSRPEVQQLYGQLEQDMRALYRKYGYLPTINLMLVYKFGRAHVDTE